MQINLKKLTAVSLVEVLVVLSIMGVLAALTVPSLKKHSQKTEYARLAQKGYVELEHAIDLAVVETGEEPDEWNARTGQSLLNNYLGKHFISARNCLNGNSTDSCFVWYADFYGGTNSRQPFSAVMLADGISIAGSGTIFSHGSVDLKRFIIDVNGPDAPNREGVDVFLFNYGKYDSKCEPTTNGSWKLCPVGLAIQLVEDNWKITYW